jgi:hypothetical protein
MIVTLESDNIKAMFDQLAAFQEIFDFGACGCCHQKQIRFVVRQVNGNKFYELHCELCKARKSFGQMRVSGDLFPHRNDKAGNQLPNDGWYHYQREAAANDAG